MKMKIPQEKALRWAAQGLTIALVAVAAVPSVKSAPAAGKS